MHIYADPSCIPVVRIEQHVMVIPQHGSSKDFLTDASEPACSIVPPLLQGQSLEDKTSGFKSGHILRAVIFVHGFQVSLFGLVIIIVSAYHIIYLQHIYLKLLLIPKINRDIIWIYALLKTNGFCLILELSAYCLR
jgi:hypothetical protein